MDGEVNSAPPDGAASERNLGLFDGDVSHAEVNQAIAAADKAVLFGEQTRLPYFPDDGRLPKLHAGDPRVLLFWKVFKKIPENLRESLLAAPFSITLVRHESLLFFDHFRRHQALHIGCRRRTVYLPEILLHAAEDRGYDYWAIAEGVIYASWMLLDYLLLVDVLRQFTEQRGTAPGLRLSELQQLRLIRECNQHRRDSEEANRSEVFEFAEGYRTRLLAVPLGEAVAADPFALARQLFDPEREQRWAQNKMERVAKVFNFPQLFLFDRDIIHGAARQIALRQGLEIEPRIFADVLHDYRDSLRFEPHPLLTNLGKAVVPKPRAVFLEQTVALGAKGLRGFFLAYRDDEPEVRALMHPLWMYLCSLSSDPAGVFARVGRCRAVGREGLEEENESLLAGILIRLDRSSHYPELVAEVAALGEAARRELAALVERQRLTDEDEWEVFKVRKQAIVNRACQVLEELEGGAGESGSRQEKIDLHQDELIRRLLADNPHRLTSDPSGLLMHLRAYQRCLSDFGPDDPDADFLLTALLVRLDRSEHYARLLERIEMLGTPAFSALHGIFEQIPERDTQRREILKQARILWSRMLARMGKRAMRKLAREEE